MRYARSISIAASILVTGLANAKCASIPLAERFEKSGAVVLVSIIEAHDGPVPWPYGFRKGALPGRLLKLRVLKVWKGGLHPNDVVYGWTQTPRIEDAYPHTEVGAQIVVFYSKVLSHEIRACNTAEPDRIDKISQELDAMIQHKAST